MAHRGEELRLDLRRFNGAVVSRVNRLFGAFALRDVADDDDGFTEIAGGAARELDRERIAGAIAAGRLDHVRVQRGDEIVLGEQARERRAGEGVGVETE